jgi:sulfotransferase family protein
MMPFAYATAQMPTVDLATIWPATKDFAVTEPRNVSHGIKRPYEVDTGMDPDVIALLTELGDQSTRGDVLPQRPFWVIGSPRSGSTWFGKVVNSHQDIFLTEETRVMSFLNRVVNRIAQDRWLLQFGQQAMVKRLGADLPGLVERFYRDLGALPHQRWGDKHPHYADAQKDPECLDLIRALFPDSQFIHLIRDGRDVAVSFRDKGWGNLEFSAHVWVKHVEHAEWFARTIAPDSWLEVRYEQLVQDQEEEFARVFEFLGSEANERTEKFRENRGREMWSAPSTDSSRIGQSTWRDRLTSEEIEIVSEIQRPTLERLGYAD